MIRILHLEVVEQATALRLRVWRDDPGDVRERALAWEELADVAREAGVDGCEPLPATLREAGQALFRWLDGPGRWLSAEIAAAANGAQALVLAIAAPRALEFLPWEVLHDGTGFLVHALNPPVLPVRWRRAAGEARSPAHRPLQALFMASSPRGVHPVPEYEQEEHDILDATERAPLDLVVEESGSLEELGALMQDYGTGFFDVLHLAGHAARAEDGTPVFAFENGEGERDDAPAPELARGLPDRPPLVFLSGHGPAGGAVPALAQALVGAGFRAVLGWERPARPADAALAVRAVYRQLAAGEALPLALVRAHARLQEAGARDWHRLRLFCAGDPTGPLVTPPLSRGRPRPVRRPAESEFLHPPTQTVKVATRAAFVGRRRLLQHGVATLRRPDPPQLGMLLHGQGGRGKSSVAARLCDRLRGEFQRVVVIGRLDETSLVNAWAPHLPDEAERRALREPGDPLRFRLQAQLLRASEAGQPLPLFVLDDFEQNQPRAAEGDIALAPHAAATLSALLQALGHTGTGRVLVTSRYALAAELARFLDVSPVPPLDTVEQEKQLRRLAQRSDAASRVPELAGRARAAADGNPRLAEWLYAILAQPEVDAAAILEALRMEEERFREEILVRRLAGTLAEADRALLGRMLILTVPVPLAAAAALSSGRSADALRDALGHASDLSLVDVTYEAGEPLYRVPRQLEELGAPLLPVPADGEAASLAGAVFDVLFPRWGRTGVADDARALELLRLGTMAGRTVEAEGLAIAISTRWLNAYRFAEVRSLLDDAVRGGGRDPLLLLNLARAAGTLGSVARAGELLREAEAACPAERDQDRSAILYHLGRWLIGQGELAEALRVYRERLLPRLDPSRDVRLRALTLRQTADVLHMRGEVDEALRMLREEVVPVFERLGDVRERAVTLGEIADVLYSQGQLDASLRIRRTELLPVYDRLGDVRERTMVQGKIADVLYARGELDEALRIRREQLLVYERLGDVRQRAVVLGKTADIRFRRGEVDEALRMRLDEQLPVFERLGDARGRAVALGKVADILAMRGEVDEALRIRRDEQVPLFEHVGDVRGRAVAMGKIADLLYARGRTDEARRIRLEEQLPVFERLGDARALAKVLGKLADGPHGRDGGDDALRVRLEELAVFDRTGDVHARAVVLGKIADLRARRGEVDEALRIHHDEQLPVFTRLGDVRSRAVTQRRIAGLLHARGETAGPIRMIRAEVIPAMERLGDVRELIKARLQLARLLLDGARAEDAAEAREHLAWCHQAAAPRGYRELAQVEDILRTLETPVPPGPSSPAAMRADRRRPSSS
jgi:tetratricopeptide (TPR) repeat protein